MRTRARKNRKNSKNRLLKRSPISAYSAETESTPRSSTISTNRKGG